MSSRTECHPAYPGGRAIGLLWGHALDGEERPVWEVRPHKDGWQLQHVHGGGHHPLTSQSGSQAHRFWPLHRVHAYDAFSLRPVLNDPTHFEVPQHQSPDPLDASLSSLFYRRRDVRDERMYCPQRISLTVRTKLMPWWVTAAPAKHTPQADPNLSKQNIKSWAAPVTHLQLIAHRRPLPCCDLDLRAWVLTLLLFQLRGIHSHQINVRDSSEVRLQQMKSHQSVK